MEKHQPSKLRSIGSTPIRHTGQFFGNSLRGVKRITYLCYMRNIVLRTGAGGYELLQIAFEERMGKKRFYFPSKVARIFKPKVIKEDRRGRKYKLINKSL